MLSDDKLILCYFICHISHPTRLQKLFSHSLDGKKTSSITFLLCAISVKSIEWCTRRRGDDVVFFFYCTHFEIYYHEIKLLQFFFVYLFHVFLFIIEKLCREYQNMRILKFFLLHLTAILCHVRDKINFLLLQWKKGSVKLRENFRFPLLRAFLTVL